MDNFTPLTATIGGILIGIAATILWAGIGRTAGVSSVAGGIIPHHRGDLLWRVAFMVGLPLGALVAFWIGPSLFAEIPTTRPTIGLSLVGLVVAGGLVGIGTRLGSGCTSGHGICGMARLSPRSFVAVGIFMATAICIVTVQRHLMS